jgi:hypothetical protein
MTAVERETIQAMEMQTEPKPEPAVVAHDEYGPWGDGSWRNEVTFDGAHGRTDDELIDIAIAGHYVEEPYYSGPGRAFAFKPSVRHRDNGTIEIVQTGGLDI